MRETEFQTSPSAPGLVEMWTEIRSEIHQSPRQGHRCVVEGLRRGFVRGVDAAADGEMARQVALETCSGTLPPTSFEGRVSWWMRLGRFAARRGGCAPHPLNVAGVLQDSHAGEVEGLHGYATHGRATAYALQLGVPGLRGVAPPVQVVELRGVRGKVFTEFRNLVGVEHFPTVGKNGTYINMRVYEPTSVIVTMTAPKKGKHLPLDEEFAYRVRKSQRTDPIRKHYCTTDDVTVARHWQRRR